MTFRRYPKIVALTGTRMSGKNVVGNAFKSYNIPVFDADVAFKFLLNYDQEVRTEIVRKFTNKAFDNRNLKLSFFDNDMKVKSLMETCEEKVFDAFFRWRKSQKTQYVIFMFSGLFELMNITNFDMIIHVYAPKDVRVSRLQRNLGHGMEYILSEEYPCEEKKGKSTYVIYNYDHMNVSRQISDIHKDIILNKN